ncbi:MAG: AgmX/PglI C-terminal domain-containing protein [Proteobacteria bacterium]|nr:AgmX/PglI C-terminal domain-containing protein [Pseudomonadota bacterium]
MAISRPHKILALVIAVAIGVGIVWFVRPATSHTTGSKTPDAPRSSTTSPTTASPDGSKPHPGTARPPVGRIAKDQRAPLIAAIREATARRTRAVTGSGDATPPPSLPRGELDKQFIQASVREIAPLLAACYEDGLARDPTMAGSIVVNFTIEGEADVGGVIGESAIDPDRSDLVDPAVRECIQETMYAIKIAPPPEGGVVKVTYPFKFSTK